MKKTWFTKEYVSFFKELARNNHKEWFHENKKRYQSYVKEPFYELVAALLEQSGIDIPVKDAVFRINKDIRFSKDKSPYKNHMGAVISHGGRRDMQVPGMYIHLEVGNTMIGGGCYKPDKDNLYRIRKFVYDHPDAVHKALADPSFVDLYGGLASSEVNKVLPKEFRDKADALPMLYNKQFYFMAIYEDEDFILRDDLLEVFSKHRTEGEKWNGLMRRALVH